MHFKIVTDDALKILSTTKFVVENVKNVYIRDSKIADIVKPIDKRIKIGLADATANSGLLNDLKKDCQLVFVQDCVNFCFWAEKGKEKWQIEYPKGTVITGGWYGLEACFKRALDNKVSVLSAKYLSAIGLRDTEELFAGSTDVQIPLLADRHKNLLEAGKTLLDKYNGEIQHLLEEANFSAVQIVKNVCKNFSSFADLAEFQGKTVYFFKRAQLVANDLGLVFKRKGKRKIDGLENLTAFADYKLPQILRQFGILVYSNELAQKIDNYVLIPKESEDEIEIRAATIWAVELIRQKVPQYSAGEIDNALWLLSQDQTKIEKPYHRTYTIYY